MSTGDLSGNVERLRSVLREVKYTYANAMPEDRLRDGDPSVLLPVLHYCLLGYSAKLAKLISSKGFELQAKTDERFVEHCWRFLREHFNFMPQLNQHQFLSKGFTERKLILVTDVAKLCKQHHHLLTRKAKLQTKRVPKGAHLESVFPPVKKDEEVTTAFPEPQTPPVVYEHKKYTQKQREERQAVKGVAGLDKPDESEGLSSEYDSDEYEYSSSYDEVDDDEGEGDQAEEDDLNGFQQSPVDFTTQKPAFDAKERNINMVPSTVSQNVTPSKGQLYFSQVVKEDSSTHNIARAFPVIVRRNLVEGYQNDQPSVSKQGDPALEVAHSNAFGGHGGSGLSEIFRDQVRMISSKLEVFQENVMAKFLLLEGRVRFLEAVHRKHLETQQNTSSHVSQKKISSVPVAKDLSLQHSSSPSSPSFLSTKAAGSITTAPTPPPPAKALPADTANFIAQIEGRCKQTQLLLESF